MFLLGLARVLAFEQPTEVESQVAAVLWLAHGGSLIRAAPEYLLDCSSLDTSLFEVANPDSALSGASWLRLEELSSLILGILRLNQNV